MADADDIAIPEDASSGGGAPRPNRRRIDPPERRALDQALALRLDGLGADPWTAKITDMVDVETGEAFHDIGPLIEHWAFAGPAKRRAAAFNAIFTAYHAQADTSGFRGYVLRLPLKKAQPGTLDDAIRAITQLYGRVMANAKRDGLAKPVAVFLHPRWDSDLGVWDVHLHCIVDVMPGKEDPFFLRLALKFSTPKSIGEVKNMASWANYCATWVLDHRDIAKWPDEAVLEFWDLKAPQLIRKTGDLASFASTIRGKAIRWEDGRVVIEDKEPPQTRQDDRGHPSRSTQQVAYAVVRFGGSTRHCAIFRYKRPERDRPEQKQAEGVPSRARMYPTTTTGPIPSTPIRDRTVRQEARRLRRQMTLWETIWPWGTPERPPGPIRRRLARAGVFIDPKRQGRLSRRQGRP